MVTPRNNKIANYIAGFSDDDLSAAYLDVVRYRAAGVIPTGNGQLSSITQSAAKAALCLPYDLWLVEDAILMELSRRYVNGLDKHATAISSAPRTPSEICKMLTLSTGHITPLTSKLLSQEPEANRLGLSVYEKKGGDEIYGWFIYVTQDQTAGDIPADLAACIKLAKDKGCEVLCLDCDGPAVPGLKTYSWD